LSSELTPDADAPVETPTGSIRRPKTTGLTKGPAAPGVAKVDPILVVDAVQRRFGGLVAVDVDHLEIPRGAITALIGPNGAGKTTLFNLLCGFDRPNSGTWSFDGKNLSGVPSFKVARMGQVRTFQLTKALSLLTVLENMKLGAPGPRCSRSCGDSRMPTSRSKPASCSRASSSTPRRRTSPPRCRAASASFSRWRER